MLAVHVASSSCKPLLSGESRAGSPPLKHSRMRWNRPVISWSPCSSHCGRL
ncbi:uncharacterized protein BDW70DRAFT_51586 [Aspergillus foveolatus]|uniref:uncharacterized protein n=1 Tax=Aspergillus foveolatus TaxID=210207 RepID=UPI003CCDCD8A